MSPRYCLFLLSSSLGLIACHSGKTITGSLQHGDMKREFTLYIPKIYTGESPVALLFNLHGYTSNAGEQMWYGDFRSIADTAGFIIVHPQGSKYRDTTHWNTGGWTPQSTVDDLGFLDQLINHLRSRYKINQDRIHIAGMSNGGEMAYHLACHIGNKIAAIASVAGSMTPETYRDCKPVRPVPMLHIHGTADQVVPYQGDRTATAIPVGIQFWVNNNHCDSIPSIHALNDSNTSDSSTVEHFVYAGPASVEHFKITGGDHTWPGSPFKVSGTNYDINASAEIWKFFDKYDLKGPRK